MFPCSRRVVYWAVSLEAVVLITATLAPQQAEQLDQSLINKLSKCGAKNGRCIDVVDDYTSMLQVHLSIDRSRGSAPVVKKRANAPEAAPTPISTPSLTEGPVQMDALDETIAVIDSAGEASFHKLCASLQISAVEWWKRILLKQASPFDLSVGFFMLVSVSTTVIACSLLAIRGKSVRNRGGRCSLLRLLACRGKPEVVARAARSLPEFHPAKHAAANLQRQSFSRYYSRDNKHKETATADSRALPTSPQGPAAEILLEAERQAVQAAATHVNKELHPPTPTSCELKPIRPDQEPMRPDPAPDPAAMELEVK